MKLSRKLILLIVSAFIALVFILATMSELILRTSYDSLQKELLRDIDSLSLSAIKSAIPGLFHQQVTLSLTYILLSLVLCSAILCVVMLIFIRIAVVKRISLLNQQVGEITQTHDLSAHLIVKGDDELSQLALAINGMLISLEEAEQALHESENRYRSLFERAPDAILVLGVEDEERGKIIAANQAAADQHGYTLEELLSLNISALNSPETNAFAGEIFDEISKGKWITAEAWHLKKDRTRFPIEIHAGPFKIKGRNYILGFDRDITSRKLVEETEKLHLQQISDLNTELETQASHLAAANAELEAYNYSVSHDMRGPLTRISGYCQLLIEDESYVAPESRPYLDRIYESCVGLDTMIDTMMELSQLSREPVKLQPVNMSTLVSDVLKELQEEHPQRQTTIKIQKDVIVQGDKNLLKILVDNLISNAWKYSSRKPDTVIEFGTCSEDGVDALFIRDHGAGFDMKDVGKLFRTFYRLHDHDEFAGSGIGLATVQRIIARHGGKIRAEGKPGVGATFIFSLP